MATSTSKSRRGLGAQRRLTRGRRGRRGEPGPGRWVALGRRYGESAVRGVPPSASLSLLAELGVAPRDFLVAYQLAEAVAQQWNRFQRMCARCRRTFSEQAVHDARVHARRLIARLALVREAVPTSRLDPVLRSLKRFLKPLGDLRDVQVQKQALTEELARYPDVAGLWIELGKEEKRLARAANAWIRRFGMDKIDRRLKELKSDLTDPCARLFVKSGLHDSVVRALEQAYAAVLQRRQQIDPARPATVHRVRIAYKRFRYTVESLPPSVGAVSDLQLSAMAHYQTALGNIQDIEVLSGFVSDYACRFPRIAPTLEPFRAHLADCLRERIREYLDQADTLTTFWPMPSAPPALAGPQMTSVDAVR